jgi:hypothetical protein
MFRKLAIIFLCMMAWLPIKAQSDSSSSSSITLFTNNSVFYYPSTKDILYSPGLDHELGFYKGFTDWFYAGASAEYYYWTTTINGENTNSKVSFLNLNLQFVKSGKKVSPYIGITASAAYDNYKFGANVAGWAGLSFTLTDDAYLFTQYRYAKYTSSLTDYSGGYASLGVTYNLN